jgi:hypothetical protein
MFHQQNVKSTEKQLVLNKTEILIYKKKLKLFNFLLN